MTVQDDNLKNNIELAAGLWPSYLDMLPEGVPERLIKSAEDLKAELPMTPDLIMGLLKQTQLIAEVFVKQGNPLPPEAHIMFSGPAVYLAWQLVNDGVMSA